MTAMADETNTGQIVQEVLEEAYAASTGIEDLETVTSLDGVESLPAQKGETLVNVPLDIFQKPARDAATAANAAAKKAEEAITGLEGKTQAAAEAAAKASEAAAKAETAAGLVEGSTGAALGGSTARFSAWMEEGNVSPDKSTKPGGSVVYVANARKFAYYVDSTLYGDWGVAGVPPVGMFMDSGRTSILTDKLYLFGDTVYAGTGGGLKLLSYRHEVLSEDAYEALEEKDGNTLYLTYEEE